MMNYELYKNMVIRDITRWVNHRYPDAEIRVHKVNKVNGIKDCISICRSIDDKVAPNIYISDMYRDYCNSSNYEKSIVNAFNVYSQNYSKMPNADILLNDIEKAYADLDNHIYIQLINREANKELLSNCPNMSVPGMPDLAVVFKLCIRRTDTGISSITITNNDVDAGKITSDIEALYKNAITNAGKRDPVAAFKLIDVALQIQNNIQIDELKKPITDLDPVVDPKDAVVITNESGICGAGCILYEGVLDKLTDKMKGAFYLLPSSKHEIIILPKDGNDIGELGALVEEATETAVNVEDRLSCNIYKYEDHQLSVAFESTKRDIKNIRTNTIEKSL